MTRRLVFHAFVVMTCLYPSVTGFLVSSPSSASPQYYRAALPRDDEDTTTTSSPTTSPAGETAVLYRVPGSGWTSPSWNWGAVGTGHDCARICRTKFESRSSRAQLVRDLLTPTGNADLEEVKLVLALAWQRGRWDGSDGGPEGYGAVLSRMAEAVRYELGDVVECRRRLLADMQSRFATLQPSDDAMEQVMSLSLSDECVDSSLRSCCGHVLQAMGFVDRGL